MATINSYLNFRGNTEEAFNFYKAAFGTEFAVVQRFGDSPGCEGMPVEDKSRIMHVSLPIGKHSVLMGTDVVGEMADKMIEGTNIALSISVESESEADQLFAALSAGGRVIIPLEKSFWGAYFGMLTDKFGIQWMINYDYNQK